MKIILLKLHSLIMKKILFALIIFVTACSNNDNPDIEQNKLTANFKFESNTFYVGNDIKITDISESDLKIVSYSYEFGNSTKSTETNPVIQYNAPGEYTITLSIKDINGNTSSTSVKITVLMYEPYDYIEESSLPNAGFFPLEIGIYNNHIFYTQYYSPDYSKITAYYRHVEFDENDKTFNYKLLSESTRNSGHSHTTFLNNGNKIVNLIETLGTSLWISEAVETNSDWSTILSKNIPTLTTYGSVSNINNFYFYGSKDGNPAIEIRDESGKLTNTIDYINDIKNGFIGDLIKNGNSYIGFGGKFENSSGMKDFENYKPLILFFDENLQLIKYKLFDSTLLSNRLKSWNDLNGSFLIRKLSNGNFVLYSHDEIRIINPLGEEIKFIKIENISNYDVNGLIVINDEFIISTYRKILKYDNNGTLIKGINFKGEITPGFVTKNNTIYFTSGYASLSNNVTVFKTFIGAIDSSLNFIKIK